MNLPRLVPSILAGTLAVLAVPVGSLWAAPLQTADARVTYVIEHPFKRADGWLEARFIRASLDFDAANPAASKFNIVLDATGFNTGNNLRDSHQAEQIGSAQYPQVKFLASSMVVQSRAAEGAGERLKLMAYGKMQWHGVLKDVSWPLEVVVGPQQVTVDAAFNLDIKDYGMTPDSIVGIAVSNIVPVKVHLVFSR